MMFIQPIAEANVVTEPDREIVEVVTLPTACPIIGIIADDRPEDDGMKIVNRAITIKIMNIAPTAGITLIASPNPLAITLFKPESVRVIAKPLPTDRMKATGIKSPHPLTHVPMKCPQPCQLITPIITDPMKNNIPASTIPQLPIGAKVVKNGNDLFNIADNCSNPVQPVIAFQSIKPTINNKNTIPNTISVHLRFCVIGGNASLSNEYLFLKSLSDMYTHDFCGFFLTFNA
ncbi:MAG: hypothetical protein MJ200_01940 [Mycoplasmoidaceae bacterium]|nr:hypothetical protein [Mycoplasmoidaceae bacterium]